MLLEETASCYPVIRIGEAEILQQKKYGELEYLCFPQLAKTGIADHLFTTRMGGVSTGIFSSLNLSYTRGDEAGAVDENFRRVAAIFDETPDRIVCSHQTHTTNVRLVTEEDAGKGVTREREFTDVDGLITDTPGLLLATFYADCVPLFFVDVRHRAIGLSHSGWRGTVKAMGQETIKAMKEAFGTRPEDLVVCIGPSICKDCFEVGEEVVEEFKEAFAPRWHSSLFTEGKAPGKYQLDLWAANRIILKEAGVPAKQIHTTNICTKCNSDYLFSHRTVGEERGNLAAFLCLKGGAL